MFDMSLYYQLISNILSLLIDGSKFSYLSPKPFINWNSQVETRDTVKIPSSFSLYQNTKKQTFKWKFSLGAQHVCTHKKPEYVIENSALLAGFYSKTMIQ